MDDDDNEDDEDVENEDEDLAVLDAPQRSGDAARPSGVDCSVDASDGDAA